MSGVNEAHQRRAIFLRAIFLRAFFLRAIFLRVEANEESLIIVSKLALNGKLDKGFALGWGEWLAVSGERDQA